MSGAVRLGEALFEIVPLPYENHICAPGFSMDTRPVLGTGR